MHKTIASSEIGPSENLLLGQHLNAEIGYSLYTEILNTHLVEDPVLPLP